MGVFQNNLMGAAAAAASAGGGDFYDHQIAKSARFQLANSSYMYRTPSSAGNRRTWTFSTWVKRTKYNINNSFFGATNGSYQNVFRFEDTSGNDQINLFGFTGATLDFNVQTNNMYRDSSAWYHIVIAFDTTQGTSSNRVKLYVNGVQQTDLKENTYPSQNYDTNVNDTSTQTQVGFGSYGGQYFDGYMAESVLIDGTQYAASDFGETKNGCWIPKDPSGLTFGTNGFYLNYASSGDLGNDVSGNNNDLTVSGLAAHDQMLDSPTFGSSSSGNFCTMNPLSTTTQSSVTALEGNLFLDGSTTNPSNYEGGQLATMGVRSGKWYWEVYLSGGGAATTDRGWTNGIAATGNLGEISGTYGPYAGGPQGNSYNFGSYGGQGIRFNNSTTSYGAGPANTNIIGMALDLSSPGSGSLTIYINNSSQGVAVNGSIADAHWVPFVGAGGGSVSDYDSTVNFGQDSTFAGAKTAGGNADANGHGDFFYAPPSGHLALCTGNLPVADAIDPAQTDDNYPQKLFSPLIWTGDGSTSRAITGLGFQPDWLWFKNRSSAFSNRLYDTSRGIASNGGKRLFTNTTGAENDQTSGQDISAVGTDGFTTGASSANYNNDTNSGGLQVGWFWRANGGTTSTNSTGSLSVTQQVDPSGSFSISTYSGDGGTDTIGHGLSRAPTMVIVKQRNGNNNWAVYAKGAGATKYAYLDSTGAFGTAAMWQNTTPSSSLVYLGDNNEVNAGSRTYVAYCFADTEGYIKSGSYVGNGNADGSFVYTGFSPNFVLYKNLASGESWVLIDNKRNSFNVAGKALFTEAASAESNSAVTYGVDLLSNGFKARATNAVVNGSGANYIYLAFAENPFKYATAR